MSALAPHRIDSAADFGRVALLVGGDSAEREVSLNGGRAVAAGLARQGIDVTTFDGAPALFAAIAAGTVDRVFNLMHGPGGEDGAIQGALQLMGVPVTGTGVLGSALTMDKLRSKWVWQRLGIDTAPFHVQGPGDIDADAIAAFDGVLFVKPAGLGSSIGVSRVTNTQELAPAVELARRYSDTVIIEQGITGGEYFAGVLDGVALPLIRIETPNAFYDYDAKYESDQTRYFCPCGLAPDDEARLQQASLAAYRALGGEGWGRVDFILDDDGRPWFLEANTVPGMTDHSLVPQAAAVLGIDFDDLVWRILETSL
ncbi:D-alanine--D-alanine ligase [Marinihelvus fidelis]|uniref:D-alanine--D-alanine ligase n=1 Tax=Marinihelvus fidelis TaxID=2613842 RepID=UPI002965F9EE|nr:D-alanine--D-alanine ligase [Marinihelvus fidelis]